MYFYILSQLLQHCVFDLVKLYSIFQKENHALAFLLVVLDAWLDISGTYISLFKSMLPISPTG